jgi:hypothetical protein
MSVSVNKVFTIQATSGSPGLGPFNASNLGLATREVPGVGFGALGYKLYQDSTAVGKDFGTDSLTYAMAVAVFSQDKNILLPGGYLAVILLKTQATEVQDILFSAAPAAGTYKLNFSGDVTAAIAFNDNAASVQTAVQTALVPPPLWRSLVVSASR